MRPPKIGSPRGLQSRREFFAHQRSVQVRGELLLRCAADPTITEVSGREVADLGASRRACEAALGKLGFVFDEDLGNWIREPTS